MCFAYVGLCADGHLTPIDCGARCRHLRSDCGRGYPSCCRRYHQALATGDDHDRHSRFWCILASRLKLGIFADFLSRPILLGLLNGVALTIIVGQFAKVLGLKYEKRYLLERIVEAPELLYSLHWQTLGLSALTLAIYLVIKRWQPRWPAAMFAIMVAALLVWALNLESVGVQVVGLSKAVYLSSKLRLLI